MEKSTVTFLHLGLLNVLVLQGIDIQLNSVSFLAVIRAQKPSQDNNAWSRPTKDQLTAEQEKNRDLEERVATQNTDLLMEPLTESEIGPPDTGLDEYCIVESQGVNSPTHELSEVLNIDASPKADQRFSDSRLRRLESSGDGAIILDNHEADHLEILQPPKNHIHASIQGCREHSVELCAKEYYTTVGVFRIYKGAGLCLVLRWGKRQPTSFVNVRQGDDCAVKELLRT
ncbi:hypothetical protein B0H10DRAFT_1968911 [Mycena sp. CBHHK59/15]|nr:hypothetical protein B0H10DRAFT_1968911 [Mycena sp. CBHHK59/15]